MYVLILWANANTFTHWQRVRQVLKWWCNLRHFCHIKEWHSLNKAWHTKAGTSTGTVVTCSLIDGATTNHIVELQPWVIMIMVYTPEAMFLRTLPGGLTRFLMRTGPLNPALGIRELQPGRLERVRLMALPISSCSLSLSKGKSCNQYWAPIL